MIRNRILCTVSVQLILCNPILTYISSLFSHGYPLFTVLHLFEENGLPPLSPDAPNAAFEYEY